jgi:hypothetical protein
MERKQLLKEDWIENALMVAGFVPVIGEIADLILIIRYIYQGKYLYAGLMLIALIPTVGDIIAKPFIFFLKRKKITNAVLKNGDELFEYLQKDPRAKKMYMRLVNHIDEPLIGKTIQQVEKVPGIGRNAANGMREAVQQHANVLQRIFRRPINIGKSIGKEFADNSGSFLKTATGRGPVAMGIKKYFRGERLSKYILKNGKAPSNWVSTWYHIVYKGSRDRKAYARKFIIANNLLDFFGLPNIAAFEDRLENNADFRKRLAEDPRFTELVGETTSEQELKRINDETDEGDGNQKSNFFDMMPDVMKFAFFKKIAQGFV